MARIKNIEKYKVRQPNLNDIVIGSRVNEAGKTVNFTIFDILSLGGSIQENMLINIAPIELEEGVLTVQNSPEQMSLWRIMNETYFDDEVRVFEVDSTQSGYYRVDKLIVTTDENNPFQYVVGEEDDSQYIDPEIPTNTLIVRSVYVHNNEIYVSKPENITVLWENIEGNQSAVNLSGFNDDIGVNKLQKDIYADVTVGAVNAGDTLSQGMNVTEVFEAIFNKTFYPTFTPYSISGTAGSAVEVGTGTKTVTVTFTRGNIVGDLDSGVWNPILVQGNVLGDVTKYWVNGDDNGTNPTKSVSVLTTLGTNTVNIAVDYAEGDQPKDSKGDNYLTPEPAGTLNGVATWTGFYYRTAIAGNSVPTATDVRNNYTARRNNAGVINLSSGTTNVRFDVFVPQGSSITQVLDTGNFNLDITSEFELQGSDFSGLDANGDEVLYKHYVRIIDNPYTVSSVLAITVT